MFGDVREEAICQTLAKRLGAVWLRAATSSPQLPPFSKRAWHSPRTERHSPCEEAEGPGGRGESVPRGGRLGAAWERALDHARCGRRLAGRKMSRVDLGDDDHLGESVIPHSTQTILSAEMPFICALHSPRPPTHTHRAPCGQFPEPSLPQRVSAHPRESDSRGRTWKLFPFLSKGKSLARALLLATPALEKHPLDFAVPMLMSWHNEASRVEKDTGV